MSAATISGGPRAVAAMSSTTLVRVSWKTASLRIQVRSMQSIREVAREQPASTPACATVPVA
eukprot:5794176-Amphidinium_carterae.1